MNDAINPKHYTSHPSGIQCIEISKHLSGCLAQAFQYVWRCGQKDDPVQELKKALWFIDVETSLTDFKEIKEELLSDLLDKVLSHEKGNKNNALLFIAVSCMEVSGNVKTRNSWLNHAKNSINNMIAEYESSTN